MPTGNLPAEGKKLFERVYDKALKGSCKGDKACAAGSAWKAVKNAGWKKDKEGNWTKKAELKEFSLAITKASLDPTTNEKRWVASTSDIDDDSFGDNMTHELFKSFIEKAKVKEPPPDEYKSEFWSGGNPYLSISHYSDQNGKAIAGVTRSLYIDSRYFKAKGTFSDNKIGEAAFKAVKADQSSDREDKIRISIAFLDYGHIHKSNGFVFKRKSIDEVCPECIVEMLSKTYKGRTFTDGLLIHLAMTRVPVNKRTNIGLDMEVERSMTTQKEDAESIIGEELAEELDMNEITRSEALITRSDDEEVTPEEIEEVLSESDEIEDDEDDDPQEFEEALVTYSDFQKVLDAIEELRSEITRVPEPVEELAVVEELREPHPLDELFETLRASFDNVYNLENSPEEKLVLIQEPFNVFGHGLADLMRSIPQPEVQVSEEESALVRALQHVMNPIAQKLDILLQERSQTVLAPQIPQRRSINPADAVSAINKSEQVNANRPLTIREIAERSAGLR